jgi:hypothetical protein
MPTIFRRTLVRAPHVHSFEIRSNSTAGWEVCEQEDEHVVHRHQYTDWHRVERASERVAELIRKLERDGWLEL